MSEPTPNDENAAPVYPWTRVDEWRADCCANSVPCTYHQGCIDTLDTLLSAPRTGADLITAERWRQQADEGWTAEHDDEHAEGDLCEAAIAYLMGIGDQSGVPPETWPWDESWWKLSEDPIRNLVKAGALIAAEIDRQARSAIEADRG